MRGRLIQKFAVVIYRIDPVASAAVVGGGYDPDLRELRRVENGSQSGGPSRVEMAPVRLPVQLDRNARWGGSKVTRGGLEAQYDLVLTFHIPDLVAAGLIDPNGKSLLLPADRIDRIETRTGTLEEAFPNPPGMFIHETEMAGYGLAAFGTPKRTLLFVYCAARRVERAA
jgi:hypothetical protein